MFYFFCFSSFAIDILGALFTFTYAHCNLCKIADTVCKSESGVCGAVWRGYREYCIPCCNLLHRFPDDLHRLLYIMDHHSNVNFGLFMVLNAGVLFNLMSLCTVLIMVAPPVVWVPMMVFSTTFILGYMQLWRCTQAYWKKFFSYLAR